MFDSKKFFITVSAVVALTACSKGDEKTQVNSNETKSSQVTQKNEEEKKVPIVQKGDKSIPLENYQELKSGNQIMFAILAVDSMPIDYEVVANALSQKYKYENDEFKKKDMLGPLKMSIDAEIEKAKSNKYYYMEIDGGLEKYDFESKSFGVPEFSNSVQYRYFNDNSAWTCSYSNPQNYRKLVVADESVARTIEGMRSKYQAIRISVYFYANEVEIGKPKLNAEIMRVKIADRKGNLLAEM